MSSLLERMVQRTRASLPGIRPLPTPRFDPRGGRPVTADMPSQTDSPPDLSEAVSAQSGWARRAPDTLSSGPAKPAKIPRDGSIQDTRSFGERAVNPALSSAAGANPAHPGMSKSGGEPLARNASEFSGIVIPAPQLLPAAHGSTLHSAAREAIAAKPVASKTPASEVVVVAREHRAAMPALQISANKSSSRPQQPASPADAASPQSGPSVTISIDHIEVRAAQAVERVRRQVFRPQVSLNDFLARQRGERL